MTTPTEIKEAEIEPAARFRLVPRTEARESSREQNSRGYSGTGLTRPLRWQRSLN